MSLGLFSTHPIQLQNSNQFPLLLSVYLSCFTMLLFFLGGHLEVCQLLFGYGADVDSQDNRKVSILMAAFRKGHIKVVKWLVKHVHQFPSDSECTRFVSTLSDKVTLLVILLLLAFTVKPLLSGPLLSSHPLSSGGWQPYLEGTHAWGHHQGWTVSHLHQSNLMGHQSQFHNRNKNLHGGSHCVAIDCG